MLPPSNPPKSHLKQPHSPQSIKTGDESHPLIDQRLMAAKLWSSPSVEVPQSWPSPLPHQPSPSIDPALTPAPTALILLMIEMSWYSLFNTWHGNALTSPYCHRHCISCLLQKWKVWEFFWIKTDLITKIISNHFWDYCQQRSFGLGCYVGSVDGSRLSLGRTPVAVITPSVPPQPMTLGWYSTGNAKCMKLCPVHLLWWATNLVSICV